MSAQIRGRDAEESIDILLVEDNRGDARLTREAFGEIDAESSIDVVTDGTKALDRLAERREREDSSLPDLALLDLNLPGKDGHEVLQAIRDDADLHHLPVLVLTSSRDDEDVGKCYDADANAYLTKPTDPDDFAELARSIREFWFEHAHLPPASS